MKIRALLLAPLLAVAVGGCRDNGASIQIQAICAPTDTCTFTNKCDAVAMGNPIVDPGVTTFLTLFLQLENQLPQNDNLDVHRLNTNDAHVDEAVVEYSGALSGKVVMGASGTIYANSTGLVAIDLIPAAVSLPAGQAYPLFEEIGTKLRIRGFLDDGTRFETTEYPITVQVSTGSGLSCPGACPQSGQWPLACP